MSHRLRFWKDDNFVLWKFVITLHAFNWNHIKFILSINGKTSQKAYFLAVCMFNVNNMSASSCVGQLSGCIACSLTQKIT